ncbi:MAG: hypothetical protein K6D90_01895 [Lachnospiraceae bacterium]|nr:hypothetical protein [Lachnospiraceae bacterium]
MMKKDKMIKVAAILALVLGMITAFLQSSYIYALTDDTAGYAAENTAGDEDVTDLVILEDEELPAAQLPPVVFPWWCWAVVIASIAAGCGVYFYIMHEEKRNAVTL